MEILRDPDPFGLGSRKQDMWRNRGEEYRYVGTYSRLIPASLRREIRLIEEKPYRVFRLRK